MTIAVLGVSILLQLVAVVQAMRMVPLTRNGRTHGAGWMLVASAILLMATRRAITLAGLLASPQTYTVDIWAELVAVAISLLLATGLSSLLPMFRRMQATVSELRESERRLSRLVDIMPVMIHAHQDDGAYIFWNRECERVTGYSREEIVGNPDALHLLYPDSNYLNNKVMVVHDNKPHQNVELTLRTKDGQQRTISWTHASDQCPLPAWKDWETGVDVTERIEFERTLTDALREKEVLLKEVHHRVKNNLQIIFSLLDMTSNRERNPTVVMAIHEVAAKIKAMSLIHNRLYAVERVDNVNIGSYAAELFTHLQAMFSRSDLRLDTEFRLADISVPVDQAIPFGLILNEGLTNVFKHAFAETDSGHVFMELTRKGPYGPVTFVLRDSGPGLPADMDHETANTLGLKLIRSLRIQLKAETRLESSPEGTTLTVIFTPDDSPRPSF